MFATTTGIGIGIETGTEKEKEIGIESETAIETAIETEIGTVIGTATVRLEEKATAPASETIPFEATVHLVAIAALLREQTPGRLQMVAGLVGFEVVRLVLIDVDQEVPRTETGTPEIPTEVVRVRPHVDTLHDETIGRDHLHVHRGAQGLL